MRSKKRRQAGPIFPERRAVPKESSVESAPALCEEVRTRSGILPIRRRQRAAGLIQRVGDVRRPPSCRGDRPFAGGGCVLRAGGEQDGGDQ